MIHATLRATDLWNDGGDADASGTVVDQRMYAAAQCAATSGPEGSICSVDTSADALTPGLVREGRSTIWEVGQIQAHYAPVDPHAVPERVTPILAQGLFVP